MFLWGVHVAAALVACARSCGNCVGVGSSSNSAWQAQRQQVHMHTCMAGPFPAGGCTVAAAHPGEIGMQLGSVIVARAVAPKPTCGAGWAAVRVSLQPTHLSPSADAM